MTQLRIGIDPGVNTGFGTWDRKEKRLIAVCSLPIHKAMHEVKCIAESGLLFDVVVEDARQRTWFSGADARAERSGAGIREGVGSVKRDASIWEDYLIDLGVKFTMRAPAKGGTKWSADYFRRVTGWEGRTNHNARDAAVLVFGGT